jgi:hypothetical protein
MNPDLAFDTLTRQPVYVCPHCGVRLDPRLGPNTYIDPDLDCPRPPRFVRKAGQRPR